MFSKVFKTVFFGAHTDDEIICAGTLKRLANAGIENHVVTFAPAAIEEDRQGTHRSLEVTAKEWHKSLDILEVSRENRTFYGYTPSADFFGRQQAIAQSIFDFCEKVRPDLAFILSPEDENPAHRIVGEACERVMRGRVPRVIRCQFPWNYGIGRANLFVSLTDDELKTKLKVIDAYQSQHFRYSYSEMLSSYARGDGLSVKVDYAEKFEIIRWVI